MNHFFNFRVLLIGSLVLSTFFGSLAAWPVDYRSASTSEIVERIQHLEEIVMLLVQESMGSEEVADEMRQEMAALWDAVIILAPTQDEANRVEEARALFLIRRAMEQQG